MRYRKKFTDRLPEAMPIIAAALVFISLCTAFFFLNRSHTISDIEQEKQKYLEQLTPYSISLTSCLNRHFSLLDALYAFVIENRTPDKIGPAFEIYAEGLANGAPALRNLIIAPGGINTFVFPVKGNESAVGHDILNDNRPEVAADIERALISGGTVISRPYELRQGGTGIVARKPIYMDGEFWGLVTMVVDLPLVLAETGFDTFAERGFAALLAADGSVFYGEPEISKIQPASIPVILPDSRWTIIAAPPEGWEKAAAAKTGQFRINGIFIIIFCCALTYITMKHLMMMRKGVSEAERRRLQAEKRYQAIFYENESVMLLIDPDNGRILDANNRALNFYGYTYRQLTGMRIFDINIMDRSQVEWQMKYARDHLKNFFSFKHRLSSGEVKDVEVYSGPVCTEGKELLYSIVHDATEKCEYQRQLKQALEEARQASKAKDDFMANISHELRTPLNGVMGMLHLMQDLKLPGDGAVWLDMARQSAENLYTVIRDLLDFSQLRTEKLRITKNYFLIEALANHTFSIFKQKAEEKGLKLEIRNQCGSSYFIGDRSRISQIIWNLLSNSIKYSDNGKVSLVLNEEHENLVITVKDEGVGIPEDAREKIFLPFTQLETPYTKTHQGMGMGLAIVKSLTALMKGSVKTSPGPDKGSIFTVAIPGSFSDSDQNNVEDGLKII